MKLTTYLSEQRERQRDELIDWLRIPSISTLPAHGDDVRRACDWLVEHLREIGLSHVERIDKEGRHPLVYAEWLEAGSDAPTVLIYGHYDVQPVDPLDLWQTPPFEPAVRGDSLYARGASDDKGQIFLHIKAIEALLATEGRLPVNVKLLIEGEEESGGYHIEEYVPLHADKLAADAVLVSDTHILSPAQPTLIYGLRGMWAGEITVTGPARDLHSGTYGGAVHNPNAALAALLAALHDADGRIAVPGFYDNVLVLSDEERAALARVPHGEAELLHESGAPAAWGEPGYSVVERTGARPTLEINGMWGGFTGEGFKTVIPSVARAKISCRLVPDQEPARIGELLRAHLAALAPPTVTVDVHEIHTGQPFVTHIDSPAIQAAARAYASTFEHAPIFTREGGGIPVVSTLRSVLAAPVVLMGFGLPDDNLHAPNEKFHLPNFYRGIETSIAFLRAAAEL